MFNITETAQEQVAAYFKDKETQPVRIFLHEGGCGGPQVVMGVDEKRENDEIYEFAGIEYVIDKQFLGQAQPVEIDFQDTGFKISSGLQLGGGCSGCGSTGSCCS
ncbi:adhesin [Desulfonema ishimotonii]|uniref:Adhesin n=1 Tax=Desulfonema ishimotonii TaxID=45657 RepID=A0A401FV56_9BACT|nr:IscA/HesB family protein [Desulfonema ishimotonii]GBC60849.1 adhesin [Desulfonema ishimotonii]